MQPSLKRTSTDANPKNTRYWNYIKAAVITMLKEVKKL